MFGMSPVLQGGAIIKDPHWNSVNLLLHFDGAENGSIITDRSKKNLIATANGSARTFNVAGKFKQGLSVPALSSFVRIPNTIDLEFGSSAFTFEAFVGFSSTAPSQAGTAYDNRAVFGKANDTSCSYFMLFNRNLTNLAFYYSRTGLGNSLNAVSGNVSLVAGVMYHVAVSRLGNTMYLFFNGNLIGTATHTQVPVTTTSDFFIGKIGDAGYDYPLVNGYIDELRYTKGVARYTTSFTPPNRAFPEK